jgi:hypothetical protein
MSDAPLRLVSASAQLLRRWMIAAIGLAAAIGGAIVALHYHRLGLTLSHYDARGHLVVARRIVDNITPGWQQIGAVWLPLPHLLNAIPVQIDLLYRTGASGVAISIAAFALTTGAIAWIVREMTGSSAAALAAPFVFALNPNVLYLQSTPMTEPLLLALTTMAVAMLIAWVRSDPGGSVPARGAESASPWTSASGDARVGAAFALACLTRYEAWPVTVCALAGAVWARWRRGEAAGMALRRTAAVARWPALAIVGFLIFSRVVVGEWFVGSGFFVPENKSLGRPMLAAAEIGWGAHALSGPLILTAAAIGVVALLVRGALSRRRADGWILVALAATAAVPWSAFAEGHPFRIRYMVPLLVVEAIGAGIAVGLAQRARIAAALVLIAVAGYELHPLDANAPMVIEAQWDRPNLAVRQRVTDCLVAGRDGEKIMASMGSLGHYMQETSRDGFALRDYLHEGNGDIWLAALDGPRPFAGWILIEEKAEGGDMLAKRARERPHFLDGYMRVCEGAGLALYKRAGRPWLRAGGGPSGPAPSAVR